MKRTRGPAPFVSIDDLKKQVSVSRPEAMRITGFGWRTVRDLCEAGEVRWFIQGCRKRIDTASLLEYQERQIAAAMGVSA